MKTKILILLLIASFTGSAAFANSPVLINGAGATFPFPLYSKWFSEYQKHDPDAQINYQSIGSGGGIKQFSEGTVDFGATDSPMTDEQLAKLPSPAFHIPTVLGAVVITYNLPEVSQPLKLTAEIVAGVFLGEIIRWNDAKIAAANPSLKLPETQILVSHRSDGSGTTGIFTDYLSKVSADWKKKVGSGTSVNWPVGLGGKGNEGVTGLIKQTPGSIGYVELIYAVKNSLPSALIRNRAGEFVAASLASVTAAAKGVNIPEDFRVSITDAPGKTAYPIGGFTYLLVHRQMKGDKGQKLLGFLHWALRDGQAFAEPLSYSPLPSSLTKRVEAKLAKITIGPN